ncbi:MAG: transcription elongation factor GreA [Patescibacteria group bacterium]|nr:transcription elongation factor GreA [Patescibacteria group bacterium]
MKKTYKLTIEGKKDLEKELEILKSKRSAATEKIAEAREFGDLKENSEYDVAREEQGLLETRIFEIEDILQNVEIIKSGDKSKVVIGSKVELKISEKTVAYSMVGPIEANPLEGKISNESPIGRALFGKKVGDKVVIVTPKGDMDYEIIRIC